MWPWPTNQDGPPPSPPSQDVAPPSPPSPDGAPPSPNVHTPAAARPFASSLNGASPSPSVRGVSQLPMQSPMQSPGENMSVPEMAFYMHESRSRRTGFAKAVVAKMKSADDGIKANNASLSQGSSDLAESNRNALDIWRSVDGSEAEHMANLVALNPTLATVLEANNDEEDDLSEASARVFLEDAAAAEDELWQEGLEEEAAEDGLDEEEATTEFPSSAGHVTANRSRSTRSRATADESEDKKPPANPTAAKKASTKSTPAKKPKTPAKKPKTPVKRTPTKRTPAKRTPAKRTPAKRTPAKAYANGDGMDSDVESEGEDTGEPLAPLSLKQKHEAAKRKAAILGRNASVVSKKK